MTRRRKLKKPEEEHTHLAIRVESYEVSADASISMNLTMDRPLFYQDDDPVYEFVSTLKISGKSTYPENRAGDTYEVSVRGDESYRVLALTLRDMQARDDCGVPIYRSYRGEQIPVFNRPPGFATMKRQRGTRIWDIWMRVAPRFVSDMLLLTTRDCQLYLSIHERKAGRDRWVEGLSLQTIDPADE